MLQLVIWILCIYLLLKGAELRLIAASSTHESRQAHMRSALIWAVLAWVAAVLFFYLSIEQGNQMPTPPSSPYLP